MENKHKKHTALQRPNMGRFGRNEWAFVGAPCSTIQNLAKTLANHFKASYKIAYLDADHASHNDDPIQPIFSLEYNDKIQYHQLNSNNNWNDFDFKQILDSEDIVLVNGNHFPALRQVVIVDPVKEASLKKRVKQLSDVQLILVKDGAEVYPWLAELLKLQSSELLDSSNFETSKGTRPQNSEITILKLEDSLSINTFFEIAFKNTVIEIHGLVLAGGKSQRMKRDKGLINYHGKPQREYLYDLLDDLTLKTSYSFRREQAEMSSQVIYDTFEGLGPFGAILSAFRENPNVAYLAVACDYPNLDKKALQFLINQRDPSKIATCFYNPVTDFPEPTICLWEPRAYARLLYFLSLGYACPRKVLINSDINMVTYEDEKILNNVNTPEEYEAQLESMKVQNKEP